LVAMTENVDRFASGDPPIPAVFAPAAGLPVVPAIPLHLAAVAAPFTSPFCPVCVVCRSVTVASQGRGEGRRRHPTEIIFVAEFRNNTG